MQLQEEVGWASIENKLLEEKLSDAYRLPY